MKSLNNIIYNKLELQAEEADELGFKKLACGIQECITEPPSDENQQYSSDELNEDLYKDLWKAASNIIKYYNINSVDAKKLGDTIELVAEAFLDQVEKTLEIDSDTVGEFEPRLIGEKE